ncbi:MAG: cyclase family protein [Candidatus Parvarchaeota archaeon]
MKIAELLEALSSGAKVYDLEQVRYPGMPAFDPVQPGLNYFLYRHHESYYFPEKNGPRTSSSGLIVMTDQSGTHIDAICHQASDLTFYDGTKVTPSIETPWGFTKLDASELPVMVKKGVLVDVAAYVSDPLPEEHEITLKEFKLTVEKEGITFGRNDIILVRTGYGKYWKDGEVYKKAAGVSKEVSRYLEDKCFAVGADNLAWDVPERKDPETHSQLPGHLYLLARKGIYIIENIYLEEISKDKVYEFLFIGLPLKFKGATGSPFRPIAIA